MASSSSSSSTAAFETRYDVFLSFRGSDTRHSFTSHLYAALSRKNLNTFMDEHDLERGEYISPCILKAIRESKYLVVIFSEDYASSRWCLDELVLIMECKNSVDRKVLPIFYRVDPSHVSDLKGNFGDGFKKLEEQFGGDWDRVEQWRDALVEAAELSGEVSGDYRHESVLIEKVAENIMKKLYPKSFVASHQLVGIDLHIQQILSCLEMGSIGVYSLGLWGMSGIGKTTIAEVVYGEISYQFDRCCFLRNIREESEKNGIVALRKIFFSKLLGIETPDVGMLSVLPAFIQETLCKLKVLVVLDDITDSKQLEALGLAEGWFRPGSRIIITSRDKQVLNIADEVYEVEGLNYSDALQLLSMKAFKQTHPLQGFEELSEKVVKYAGGVPLALTVLGSHLHKRSPDEWELQLNKLKESPEPCIQKILKISYDGLEDDMIKVVFLDIACLFKGYTVNSVTDILHEWAILRLHEKCLITVKGNVIEMHDLIQEMGRQIAQSNGKWLLDHKDIYQLVMTKMRNEAVEGILLDISEVENIPFGSTVLDMSHSMPNLRLLKFYHKLFWRKKQDPVFKLEPSQSNDIIRLPHKLKLLHWEDYPFESIPSNFFMQNLVELALLNSNVRQLWEGKCPENLKRLDLSHSGRLRRLPDLSSARKLEKIRLEKCESLVEIPPSIQCLHNLTDFFLGGCSHLESIPSLSTLASLRRLILTSCLKLRILPETPRDIELIGLESCGIMELSSIPYWEKVTSLSMANCKNLVKIPSLVHLKSLAILNLARCSNLKMLPEIPNCIKRLELKECGLETWSPNIGKLENLRFLDMKFCRNLKSFPSLIHSESLHTLYLQGCKSLRILPEIPSTLKSFEIEDSGLQDVRGFFKLYNKATFLEILSSRQELSFRNCEHLEVLPEGICDLKCLQTLDLSGCSKLTKLPPLNCSNSLKRLVLDGCGVVIIPSELPASLVECSMNNWKNLEILPDCIYELRCLQIQELSIRKCKHLEVLPDTICELKCLQTLDLSGCSRMTKLPPLNGSSSLKRLVLDDSGVVKIPSELPASLVECSMKNCNNLELLPESISELRCLETLVLNGCSKLANWLPWNGLKSVNRLMLNGSSSKQLNSSPSSLVKLRMENLRSLEIISVLNLEYLQLLDIRNCLKLLKLPPLNGLISLQDLLLMNCGITEIPTKLPPLLVSLLVYGCSNLKLLPESINELKFLEELCLTHCSSLEKLPPLDGLNSLKMLDLKETAIVEIPGNLPSSLGILSLVHCQSLRILPRNIFELEDLEIGVEGCSHLFKSLSSTGLQSLLRRPIDLELPWELRREILLRESKWCQHDSDTDMGYVSDTPK